MGVLFVCGEGLFQRVFRSLGLHWQYSGQAGTDIAVLADLNMSCAFGTGKGSWFIYFLIFFLAILFRCTMAMVAAAPPSWPRSYFRLGLFITKLGLHLGIGRYVGG